MKPVSPVKGALRNPVVGSGKDVSWLQIVAGSPPHLFPIWEGLCHNLCLSYGCVKISQPLQRVIFVVVPSHPAVIRTKCREERKKKKPKQNHTLLSDFRYTIIFHRQPCLGTSSPLHRTVSRRRHSMSAKNLISQLSLPEQFLLFLFTFWWNWSLPTSICSWGDPYS